MKKYLVDNKYFDNEQKAINRFAKRILTKGKSEIKVYKETGSEKGKDNYETLDYFNLDDFAEGYKWKEEIKKYMLDKYKDNDTVFNEFRSGLVVPKEYSGKTVNLYIDKPKEVEVTDYQGNKETVTALSGVYIAPTEFTIQHSIEERNDNIDNELEDMNYFELLGKDITERQKDIKDLETRKIY